MERLTHARLPNVRSSSHPLALWSGGGHRLDACSMRAERLVPGKFEVGRTARSLFPEHQAVAARATLDAAMDTGEPVILRQRLWKPVARLGLPDTIKLVARPLFADDGAARPLGVLSEVHMACDDPRCDALDRCCKVPTVDRFDRLPEYLTYGAMSFYETTAHGLTPEGAVGLVDIRMAARDAFVESVGPLVEELRRLRQGVPAGPEIHPRYQPRRPS